MKTSEEKMRALARTKGQTAFLRAFSANGNVSRSCREAKVGRRTLYTWLEQDARFKRLYNEALEMAVDELEEEARRRAVDGVTRPIYQGGEHVGDVQEYSDTLLCLLLKGRKPEVYRERREYTGKDGSPLFPAPEKLSDEEIEETLQRLAEKQRTGTHD